MQQLRVLLWIVLMLSAAVMTYGYLRDTVSYGQVIHESGDWAARLLLLTLAATPLRMMFPRTRAASWLMARRRDLGLATFVYAALHTWVYVARKADLDLIVREGSGAELWTGWLALLAFVPLALTSNDASVRWLGASWKALHRIVYAAAILMFAHWLLTAFDMTVGLIYSAVFAVIVALRVFLSLRRSRQAVRPSTSSG